MAEKSIDIEALKSRLNVCLQQLECNSLINTAKRKDALKDEIQAIELQLAHVLGIKDDNDDDGSGAENHSGHIKREGGTTTPESAHLPPINSPGCTRSPSPFIQNLTDEVKVKNEESPSVTPPMSGMHISDTAGSDFSAVRSSSAEREAESVRSALVDAGEDALDIDQLLKEQEQMERRMAELKRRREEEDEAFARSIQEEEYMAFQRQAAPPTASSSSANGGRSEVQSRLDRARQERMDAEMAKIFAEAETSSFNLAVSPKKTSASTQDHISLVPSAGPVFSIFEKRLKQDPNVTGPSTGPNIGSSSSSSAFLGLNLATGVPQSNVTSPFNPMGAAPGFMPASAMVPGANTSALQSHAAAILASASASGSSTQAQQQAGQSQMATQLQRALGKPPIDLTKPHIDLTQQVYDLSSDDEERLAAGQPGPSSGWQLTNALSISMNDLYNTAASTLFGRRTNHWGSDYWLEEEEDYDEEDEENEYGDYGHVSYEQWMHHQTNVWAQRQERDYSRNLTTAQAEQELRELLANVEATEEDIAPQDRTGTPDGMATSIALLEHQKIGLTWLQKMEAGSNRGGILGDDMGLGKTVQSMALIVSRPCGPIDDPVIWDDRKPYFEPPPESKLVKTKATLIIAPVALIYQWAEELRDKTQPGLLKVHIYHGNSKISNPEILRRYDVIITTTGTVSSEFGVKHPTKAERNRPIGALFKAHYHRVIIDEAHLIKNKATKAAKACACLAATYRWCLTGTPIQNTIDELYSLINFLRIKPYNDWNEFRTKISNPMKKRGQYGKAMQRVQALMKAICLRRTKTCKVDGMPILNLPNRNVAKVETPFSVDERAFYTALETRTRERFNAYVKAGTVMKNYSNILLLLLRLRQACCHPHLITDFEKAMDEDAPRDQRAHVDRLLDNLLEDVRKRLIERGMDAVECPICMDIGEESVILSGCGHLYCRACITAHLSRHEEEDRKCPECRRLAPMENLIAVADFNARYNTLPEVAPEDPKGKGKAVDNDGDPDSGKLPDVVVPEELDEWISSSKIDKMIEVARTVVANKEKVVVFSQFTSYLTLMERPLRDEGIAYLRYDGTMSASQRNDAVHRMTHDPSISLMLISLKCGALGLNLTAANHVVMMDPWWNPSLENQAIDRVHRIGQRKDVHVHRLCIPDTVEDRILALQAKKQALADGALGEGEVPKLAKLGLQELMYLFRGE